MPDPSPEPTDDARADEEMARRVRIVTAVTIGVAITLIALSSLTLKTGQVNDIPLAPPARTDAPPADAND